MCVILDQGVSQWRHCEMYFIYYIYIYIQLGSHCIYNSCTMPLAWLHLFDTFGSRSRRSVNRYMFSSQREHQFIEPDRKKTFAMHFAFINSIVALLIKDLQNFANFPTQEFASFAYSCKFPNPIPTFRRFRAQFRININHMQFSADKHIFRKWFIAHALCRFRIYEPHASCTPYIFRNFAHFANFPHAACKLQFAGFAHFAISHMFAQAACMHHTIYFAISHISQISHMQHASCSSQVSHISPFRTCPSTFSISYSSQSSLIGNFFFEIYKFQNFILTKRK